MRPPGVPTRFCFFYVVVVVEQVLVEVANREGQPLLVVGAHLRGGGSGGRLWLAAVDAATGARCVQPYVGDVQAVGPAPESWRARWAEALCVALGARQEEAGSSSEAGSKAKKAKKSKKKKSPPKPAAKAKAPAKAAPATAAPATAKAAPAAKPKGGAAPATAAKPKGGAAPATARPKGGAKRRRGSSEEDESYRAHGPAQPERPPSERVAARARAPADQLDDFDGADGSDLLGGEARLEYTSQPVPATPQHSQSSQPIPATPPFTQPGPAQPSPAFSLLGNATPPSAPQYRHCRSPCPLPRLHPWNLSRVPLRIPRGPPSAHVPRACPCRWSLPPCSRLRAPHR